MYDNELLIEKLQLLLEALMRIPRRFENIRTPADFYSNEEGIDKLDAICMTLIAVGEEVKNIDRRTEGELLCRYPSVPWKGVMGMRDILAHTYFQIDAEQLFNICETDLPVLIETVELMLADLQKN